MTAKQQIEKLANYIMANFPEDIIDGGAGDVAILIMERLKQSAIEDDILKRPQPLPNPPRTELTL